MDAFVAFLVWSRIICQALVAIPFALYCLWIGWTNKSELYIRQRRPALAFFQSIDLLITSIGWVWFNEPTCHFDYCSDVSLEVHMLASFLVVGPFMILMAARVWFLYFDLKYSEAMLSHEWWKHISEHHDWFIDHRNRFGKLGTLMCSIILSLCVGSMLMVLIGTFSGAPSLIVGQVIVVQMGSLSFVVYCLCKMPKHYDVLLIRKEINIMCTLFAVISVYFFATLVSGLDRFIPQLNWLHSYVCMFEFMVFAALPTLWPHRNVRSMFAHHGARDAYGKKHSDSDTKAEPAQRKLSNWVRYVNACSDDTNWNSFMRRLSQEFAVESLCFTLEALQFKQQFIPNYNALFAENSEIYHVQDQIFGWFMKTPDCLPKSAIIEEHTDSRVQMKLLYEKYIAVDSNLEINISHETRVQFTEKMYLIVHDKRSETELMMMMTETSTEEDEQMKQTILQVFDEALFQMLMLLRQVFSRSNLDLDSGNIKTDIVNAMMEIDKNKRT